MLRHQVLVVEDDASMQTFYSSFFAKLHAEEFVCFLAQDGDHALRVLASEVLDLVVLDWMLPGCSGAVILQAIRAHPKTRGVGVLVVTCRSAPSDAVLILESGADDYLAKPFDIEVLLAKLHSLLRRRQLAMTGLKIYELPGLRWDALASRLTIQGRRVHLCPKETDLLRIFLERPNMIHAHSFLWDAVWGYECEGWEHIVISVVSSLRNKLGPKWGPRLEAIKSRGYIFNHR